LLDLQHFSSFDAQLVQIATNIHVLRIVSFPSEVQDDFLKGWRAKNPRIPQVTYPKLDFRELRQQLTKIIDQTRATDSIGKYLSLTAASYHDACLLLEGLGTPRVTELSTQIYGRPGDTIERTNVTNLDAANHFVKIANEFAWQAQSPKTPPTVSAERFAEKLQQRLTKFFTQHSIQVAIDPSLSAKAAAGGRRIRIRGNTKFTSLDVEQLWQHEALVHSLTAINGREQPHLKSMGLGAPRTTCCQEGLATFAELVSAVIDLSRLKRIALRILAIDQALKGADFIDTFRFFLEAGQSEPESFQSAMRIFRGGGIFTKDTVYLHGLMTTTAFFKKALHDNRLDRIRLLFAGRMAFEDVALLEPLLATGLVRHPIYEPTWLADGQLLAGFLAFSLFVNRMELDLSA